VLRAGLGVLRWADGGGGRRRGSFGSLVNMSVSAVRWILLS